MPGWYIHMDAARKALDNVLTNPRAAELFAAPGKSAADISQIAHQNSAYMALGAIGPDIFFLLPDFKSVGSGLASVAATIIDFYTKWDDTFVAPYEAVLEPISWQTSDEVNALSGGLAAQLSDISSRASALLQDMVITLLVRQYDVFGLLGSGVPEGYDEKTFYWSDMLHYRRTYRFATRLWQLAGDDPRLQAFALGWMSHLATDVAGHGFVNEKCGGPWRLHWQRHHLVENHMDARVYDSEHGTDSTYQMISCAALHLAISFNDDGSSLVDWFTPFAAQPGFSYTTGDAAADLASRKAAFDHDPNLPPDLASFIVKTLHDVYDGLSSTQPAKDQCAPHPLNLSDLVPGQTVPQPGQNIDGFPTADNVSTTYWYLYKYIKLTTTDFFNIRRPTPPSVILTPPAVPMPPNTGDTAPGSAMPNDFLENAFDLLLDILAWLEYLGQVALYPASVVASVIAGAGTYPVREVLYETVELPLYNGWLALHWYLSMTGFVAPMEEEINMGLVTLGVGVADNWTNIIAALGTLDGGLNASAATAKSEPSGRDRDRSYPREPVTDAPSLVQSIINQAVDTPPLPTMVASEFLRPWQFPLFNNDGTPVKSEQVLCAAGPFLSGQDATALMAAAPGDNELRKSLMGVQNSQQTINLVNSNLPKGKHLGDPVDYTAYVIAQLTRDGVESTALANFNLDADRGYGFLCWDWVRSKMDQAAPKSYPGQAASGSTPASSSLHEYRAPLNSGFGWDIADTGASRLGRAPANAQPLPKEHVLGTSVDIRYIDLQAN
jgi:hypothetical protein